TRVRRKRDGAEMVLVPGGRFKMGENNLTTVTADTVHIVSSDSVPKHDVELTHAYWMDVHEVTNEQFQKFVQETGYVTDAERRPEDGRQLNAQGWPVKAKGASWKSPMVQGDDL